MKNLLFLVLLSSSLLLSACGPSDRPAGTDAEKAKKYTEVIQKGDTVVDPVHGLQTGFSYGAIAGVAPAHANGVTYLKTFEDGTSVLTVNVNILKAAGGTQYAVVLQNKTTSSLINVGILESILGDTRHSVELETKDSLSGYTSITVYLGKDLVAEGTLKEVKKP